jgi:hypothetical protein
MDSLALGAASVAVVLAAMGCGDGDIGGSGAGAGSGASGNGASGAGASGANGSGPSAGGGPGSTGAGGAPPCRGSSFADAVRVTDVPADAIGGSAFYAPGPTGAHVAFEGSDGKVHVAPIDALDQRAGADLVVDAVRPFGLAATAAGVFLLATRAPDYMTFFHLDATGAVVASADLVGGGDHEVEGTEWFGEFANTGKLVATADDRFAAYIALHRRWPDGIGHQGDTLRLLDASGAPQGGGWGWGCSHSMDQRIAVAGADLGPVCIADCYPAKGIFFANGASEITDDPTANCAGGVGTVLGGMVAVADGFWLSYGKGGGGGAWDMHLVKLGLGGETSTTVPLEAPSGAHRIARFDGGLLSATGEAGGTSLRRADLAGAWTGETETLSDLALPQVDEISSLPSGEVGWATSIAGALKIVRVRQCQ